MKPACFDDEQQYSAWLDLFGKTGRKHANVCQDCTPCFAARMRKAGRCENPSFKVPNPYTQVDLPSTTTPGPQKAKIPLRVVLSL